MLRAIFGSLLTGAVIAACGAPALESTDNLERLARSVADSDVSSDVADGCIRIHHIWKDQLQIAARMVDQSRRERNRAFMNAVYRPHQAFWEGYVGDERAFTRQVAQRWTALETDPRATIPLETDVGAMIREVSERVAAMVAKPIPCSDWRLVYGPGYTNMGGLGGGGGMLVDFLGFPTETDSSQLLIYTPHEVAHVLFGSRSDDPDANTLLHIILNEGFATYFSILYSEGSISPAQALGYTDAEWQWAVAHERQIWQRTKPVLGSRDRDTQFSYRAAREQVLPGAPGKIGYFLGLRIVDAYTSVHGEGSWRDIFALDLAEFWGASGYDPRAP